MYSIFSKKLPQKSGFTIIEVMISASLFIVVMVVSTTALMSIIDANKKSLATRSVVDSLTLAIEGMIRDMRTGTEYRCGDGSQQVPNYPNCASPGLEEYYNRSITYRDKETTQLVRYRFYPAGHSIQVSYDGGYNWYDVTTNEVIIEDMRFYVTGAESSDAVQPRVLITLKGHTGAGKYRTEFNLQTTVTQRDIDK